VATALTWLTEAAGGVVTFPENGWDDLKRMLATDLAKSQVLPIQMNIAFRGLNTLDYLTEAAYDRQGGLLGLETSFIQQAILGGAGCDASLTEEHIRRLLVALVDPESVNQDNSKTCPRTKEQLKKAVGDSVTSTVLVKALDYLEQKEIVRKARTAKAPTWCLDHDYLCRGVMEAQRRAEKWAVRLQQKGDIFRRANWQGWWSSLLTLSEQGQFWWQRIRSFLGRGEGGFHFKPNRSYLAWSLLRFVPLLLLTAVLSVSGWALWDLQLEQAQRSAETEKTVTAALTNAQQSEARAKRLPCASSTEAKALLAEWRDAEASLAEAEAALRTGTATEELRERVANLRQQIVAGLTQAKRKENLFRDLDDARMAMAAWKGSFHNTTAAAVKYAAAFSRFGLEVQPGKTEVLEQRIRDLAQRIRDEEPAIREALNVALWHWAICVRMPESGYLLSIASRVDDDTWRQDFRQALEKKDITALVQLSKKARSRALSPASLQLLAWGLNMVQGQMVHWQNDPNLASLRDPKSLEELTGDEPGAWQRLWTDVDSLRAKAQEKKGSAHP
jgi:hypothetical protein